MSTTTVRLGDDVCHRLKRVALKRGRPVASTVEEAIERYRRKLFLERAAASYAALRQDDAAWRDLEAERAEWDATLYDGMEDE